MFQGRIVQPAGTKAEDGILYVRARNGMARKVRVEKAVIEFDEDVPKSQRVKDPAKSLCDETLVRVTAEQSDKEDGEWTALTIVILPEVPAPQGDSSPDGRLRQANFVQKATDKPKDSEGAAKAAERKPDPDGKAKNSTKFCVR